MTAPHSSPKHGWFLWTIIAVGFFALLGWKTLTLEERPLHGDEAVQSYLLARAAGEGTYRFNPEHFHGPLPHRLNALWLKPLGKDTYASFTAFDVRIGALLAASAGLALVIFLAGRCRAQAGLYAGLLFGLSPLAYYYSQIYFHENFLLVCALLAPTCLFAARATGKYRYWVIAGLAFGGMITTKSTWLMIAISWLCASIALCLLDRWLALPRAITNPRLRPLGFFLFFATALLCALAFYTDFFSRWQGAWDPVRTFFAYTTDVRHDKPWYFYLRELLFYRAGFGEGTITGLAVAGWLWLLFGKTLRTDLPRALLWLSLAGAAQLVAYTLVPYKTPWLILIPLAYLAPWSAWVLYQLACLPQKIYTQGLLAGALVLLIVGFDGCQIARTTPTLESRNGPAPLAYVPTSTDVPAMAQWVRESTPEGLIAVCAADEAIWPLPWYLRQAGKRVGYYYADEQPHGDFAAYVFVNRSPSAAQAKALAQTHMRRYGTLFLPGQALSVYVPKASAQSAESTH